MSIPGAELRVLRVLLSLSGWRSIPEIEAEGKGIHGTYTLLQRLQKRGMVEKRGSGREVQWSATGKGKRVERLIQKIEEEG